MLSFLLCGQEGGDLMIVQQINLYQDRFRTKRMVGSFDQLITLLVLLVAGIGVASYLLSSQLQSAQQRLDQVRAEQARLSSQVVNLNAEIDALVRNSGLDQQIELTARELAAHRRALRYIQSDQENYGQGFSPFLSAIARVNVPEIWLQKIRYSYDSVYLKGSSLNEEVVPGYFASFSDEDALSDRQFEMFEVNRSEDWKVDFEISTEMVP